MLGRHSEDGAPATDGGILGRLLLPVGELTKVEVRERAAALGLRTADKADSQDVCFIRSDAGRAGFLADRLALRPGRVVDRGGSVLGEVPAVQLVTIGQRRGLGTVGGSSPRYVVDVDVDAAIVTVGDRSELAVGEQVLRDLRWAVAPEEGPVTAQSSAHGPAWPADMAVSRDGPDRGVLRWREPQRRVAPGQAVVLYRDDLVLGGGLAA
jgi:tRNA-specific 2-thiouridylase